LETSEAESWQNGKMERTAAKKSVVRFWNCKKQTFSTSRLQRPGMTSSLKKLLADCFKTSSGRPEAVAYAETFHGGVNSAALGSHLYLVCAVCDVTEW